MGELCSCVFITMCLGKLDSSSHCSEFQMRTRAPDPRGQSQSPAGGQLAVCQAQEGAPGTSSAWCIVGGRCSPINSAQRMLTQPSMGGWGHLPCFRNACLRVPRTLLKPAQISCSTVHRLPEKGAFFLGFPEETRPGFRDSQTVLKSQPHH